MIGLFQKTNMMKNPRTVEYLYTMVNFVHRPSRGNEIQRRHAPSMQALPSLMAFLEREILQYPIKSYKDQCSEHMINNGMWGVFSLSDPRNKEKRWGDLLNRSRLPLDYVNRHVQSIM